MLSLLLAQALPPPTGGFNSGISGPLPLPSPARLVAELDRDEKDTRDGSLRELEEHDGEKAKPGFVAAVAAAAAAGDDDEDSGNKTWFRCSRLGVAAAAAAAAAVVEDVTDTMNGGGGGGWCWWCCCCTAPPVGNVEGDAEC